MSVDQMMALTKDCRFIKIVQATSSVAPRLRLRKCQHIGGIISNTVRRLSVASTTAEEYTGVSVGAELLPIAIERAMRLGVGAIVRQ